MTEETAKRLDYSKPPPGYTVRFEDSSGSNGDGPPLWWYGAPHYLASMGSEAEALAAAWAHHKAHNDPPGLVVEAEARAAAWAWHDRRLALVIRAEAEGVQVDLWPRALAWADADCVQVEAWLPTASASTDDEYPEVLRG